MGVSAKPHTNRQGVMDVSDNNPQIRRTAEWEKNQDREKKLDKDGTNDYARTWEKFRKERLR